MKPVDIIQETVNLVHKNYSIGAFTYGLQSPQCRSYVKDYIEALGRVQHTTKM